MFLKRGMHLVTCQCSVTSCVESCLIRNHVVSCAFESLSAVASVIVVLLHAVPCSSTTVIKKLPPSFTRLKKYVESFEYLLKLEIQAQVSGSIAEGATLSSVSCSIENVLRKDEFWEVTAAVTSSNSVQVWPAIQHKFRSRQSGNIPVWSDCVHQGGLLCIGTQGG